MKEVTLAKLWIRTILRMWIIKHTLFRSWGMSSFFCLQKTVFVVQIITMMLYPKVFLLKQYTPCRMIAYCNNANPKLYSCWCKAILPDCQGFYGYLYKSYDYERTQWQTRMSTLVSLYIPSKFAVAPWLDESLRSTLFKISNRTNKLHLYPL